MEIPICWRAMMMPTPMISEEAAIRARAAITADMRANAASMSVLFSGVQAPWPLLRCRYFRWAWALEQRGEQ